MISKDKNVSLCDQSILITGGTGSFGNAVLKYFLDSNIKEIRIFSRDEKKQEDLRIMYQSKKLNFVVGDVRDERGLYRGLPYDTIGAFKAAGLALYNDAILVTSIGSLPIRVGHQFTSTRKMGKCHQNVLVFLKGDPRRATEAAGDAQFGSVEQAPGAEVLQ